MRYYYQLLLITYLVCETYSIGNNVISKSSLNNSTQYFAQKRSVNGGEEGKIEKLVDENLDQPKTSSKDNQTNEVEPAKDDQSKKNQTKSNDVDISSIRKEIEKYHKIDKPHYDALCSDNLLQNSPAQTLHSSGENFVLILDDYNLTFKFVMNEMNKYYPKLTKLPYRCTSYCELKQKHPDKKAQITRFKYSNYLIEVLNQTDHKQIKFYLEDLKYLDSEDQKNHLVEVLSFIIENDDGCKPPVPSPTLKDRYTDNLLTNDLINIFCNKKVGEKLNATTAFLIREQDGFADSLFKIRNMIFFTYPIAESYNLASNLSENTDLKKSNMANPVKKIQNVVQLKLKDKLKNKIDIELYVTFTKQQMFILQKSQRETQLVEHPPVYAIQNYYTCPQPLCLDPYFDDLFLIRSCDFDLLFDFLPKSSRLLLAFRGNYFYLINSDNGKAPKIDQAIPIDYLFKEILGKPDIDFNYLNAGEYVEKSKVIILFKDQKYIFIDPIKKIVTGPFETKETFKYADSSPESVFMDGDHLVMIQKSFVIRYLWSAPVLTGKHDFSLDDYISFHSMSEINDNEETETPIIDAVFKEDDSYFFFADDNMIELTFDKNGQKNAKILDVTTEFFRNCKSYAKKSSNQKKQLPNLDKILGNIRNSSLENTPLFRDANSTDSGNATNSSICAQLNYLTYLVLLLVAFVIFFKSI